MARTIIIDGAEEVACPKCSHPFPLTEGISKQTIERHAEDFERAFAERKKHLEAQLAAEARRQYEIELKAMQETLEEAKKNQDLDYQRKLDEERKRIEAQARDAAHPHDRPSARRGRRPAGHRAGKPRAARRYRRTPCPT